MVERQGTDPSAARTDARRERGSMGQETDVRQVRAADLPRASGESTAEVVTRLMNDFRQAIDKEYPEHVRPCACYHHRDDLAGMSPTITVMAMMTRPVGTPHNNHVIDWLSPKLRCP